MCSTYGCLFPDTGHRTAEVLLCKTQRMKQAIDLLAVTVLTLEEFTKKLMDVFFYLLQ